MTIERLAELGASRAAVDKLAAAGFGSVSALVDDWARTESEGLAPYLVRTAGLDAVEADGVRGILENLTDDEIGGEAAASSPESVQDEPEASAGTEEPSGAVEASGGGPRDAADVPVGDEGSDPGESGDAAGGDESAKSDESAGDAAGAGDDSFREAGNGGGVADVSAGSQLPSGNPRNAYLVSVIGPANLPSMVIAGDAPRAKAECVAAFKAHHGIVDFGQQNTIEVTVLRGEFA